MTEADKSFCESWCKAHARKWQVLNRAQWKYQFHEKTLVRFVDEVQLREDEISLLLEFLASDDCVPTLCLYDQDISPEWKPTRAWLEISNRSVGSVHAVRLYHGLMTELSALGDGPYLVENGCARKVSLTYFWNQASVQTVPASSSGVSYRITGLTRDRDTGLYTYAIEKLERVQQDVAEYFTAKTVFAEQTEEYHLGVKQSAVDSTGKQASVGNGKKVRRKISKNADCTSDVHNTTEIEKKAEGASESVRKTLTGTTVTTVNRNMPSKAPTNDLNIGDAVENSETEGGLWNQTIRRTVRNALDWIAGSCRKTVFAHSHSDTVVQSEDPGFTHVEEAGDGVVSEKNVSLTADGAYQVTDRTTTEKPVERASESVHATLTGTTVTTVNRNMADKAPTDGLAVGESVENSETEGGRWNQTIRRVMRSVRTKISDSCAKTIFAHRQGTVRVQGADPGFTHVAEAGDGVVRNKSVTLTADGAYRVEENTTTEKKVEEASETIRKGLTGTTRTVTNRNMPEKAGAEDLEIGESVENSRTDGGRWNQTFHRIVRSAVDRISDSCRKTVFAHVHSAESVQGEDPGFTHTEEAGDGRVTEKSVSRTQDGSYRVSERVTEEKPVTGSSESVRRGIDGTTVVSVNRNMPEKASAADLAVGESVENTETDGGRWNQTVRRVMRSAVTHIADSCSRTIFAHKQGRTDVRGTDPGFTHVNSAGGGVVRSASVTLTGDGSYRVDENSVTEIPVKSSSRTASMGLHGLSVRTENRNQPSPLPDPTRIGISVTNRKTDGGLYDTVKVEDGMRPAGKIADSCSHDYFTHHHSVVKNEAELADPEHVFEVGRIVSKSGRLNSNGTADNTENVVTAVPQINQYTYRRGDGSVVHVVKYHNQQISYLDQHPALNGSNGLEVSDYENHFGLHDGTVSWVENAKFRWVFSDKKFIKHGEKIPMYDVWFDKRLRRWCHLKWYIQLHWIRGDAYTDYVADEMRANPKRDTPGVMFVQKLAGPYSDGDGNELAEWKWIELVKAESGESVFHMCDENCKDRHSFVETHKEVPGEFLEGLLGRNVEKDENYSKAVVQSLNNLPSGISAAMSGSALSTLVAQGSFLKSIEEGKKKEEDQE